MSRLIKEDRERKIQTNKELGVVSFKALKERREREIKKDEVKVSSLITLKV